MTQEIANTMAGWLKANPNQNLFKLYTLAVEQYERKHRGDIVSYIPPTYDSRLQQPVDYSNFKKRQQYLRWIKNRKQHKGAHLTFEQWQYR